MCTCKPPEPTSAPDRPTRWTATARARSWRGACTRVRITGSRNDVTVYVVPAATLDAMGSRNSIVYRLIGPGRQPMLLNEGESNTYYRNSRARGDQDHDWWQAPR